ncbi:hypothetical protein ACFV9E_01030 [Streptomyces sp. NPDC059835]|uniref:hypothetical protein n=1 Tax=Streptomyces sp. NPDC059835 TaxID=3346967 RepID=UPI00365409DF
MGTDMFGYIEARWDRWRDEDDREWHMAIDTMHLYNGRSYLAFGCLFGVRDNTFRPLAADRGLPPDASEEVRAQLGDGRYGDSWITWAELSATDWNEPATEVDDCVLEYRRDAEGAWEMYGRNTNLTRFAELSGITDPRALHRAARSHPEGTEWHDGDHLFRIGRLRRKDAVDSEWEPIWSVMRTLAAIHGDDAVRLVAGFG